MEKDYHNLGDEKSPIEDKSTRRELHDLPTREVPQPTDIPTREVGTQKIPIREVQPTEQRTDGLVTDIAMVCHEANRAYCVTLGDYSQRPWSNSPLWQQDSAINGVLAHVAAIRDGREMSPRESHESWLKQKVEEGWVYGATKNPLTKEHPCVVPYDELPEAQRRKDVLFGAIVKAMAGPL